MCALGQSTVDNLVSAVPYAGLPETNGAYQPAASDDATATPASPHKSPNFQTDLVMNMFMVMVS